MGPFAAAGSFWRGSLHAHSDRSDGALSPEAVAARYRAAGYDFLALTDHFRPEHDYPVTDIRHLHGDGFTTLLGAELHAPGPLLSTEWHVVAVGLPPDFAPTAPDETGPQLARRARDAGAFVVMAHPAASLLVEADAAVLDAAHAVETWNVLAAREGRADSWYFYDTLLARGRRLHAVAADDAHFQPHDPPGCRAWVQVRAPALEPDLLLRALKDGAYYSSTGPDLLDLRLDGHRLHVRTSPVTQVVAVGTVPGPALATASDPAPGTDLPGRGQTSWSVDLGHLTEGVCVRVIATDVSGEHAWSNPVWL